jgi:hypothetical protein
MEDSGDADCAARETSGIRPKRPAETGFRSYVRTVEFRCSPGSSLDHEKLPRDFRLVLPDVPKNSFAS